MGTEEDGEAVRLGETVQTDPTPGPIAEKMTRPDARTEGGADKATAGDKADKPATKTETPAAKPAAKADATPAKAAKPAPGGS